MEVSLTSVVVYLCCCWKAAVLPVLHGWPTSHVPVKECWGQRCRGHCCLLEFARTWDGTGCKFDSGQCPMFIEPTITRVPLGFPGYIWVDTKIVLKKNKFIRHFEEKIPDISNNVLSKLTSSWYQAFTLTGSPHIWTVFIMKSTPIVEPCPGGNKPWWTETTSTD